MRTFADRIALFLLTGLALATVAGFSQGIVWPHDVFAHFRWQYVVVAVALTPFLAFRGRLRSAAVAALLVGVNGIPVADVHFARDGGARAAGTPMTGVKVVSLNLWHRNPEHETVLQFIRRSNADLVLLTEVTETWRASLSTLSAAYPDLVYAPDTGPHNGVFLGLMVLSKIPVVAAETHVHGPSGHVFAQELRFGDPEKPWSFFGVHLSKPLFDEAAYQRQQVRHLIRTAAGATRPIVVAGDFNLTPFSPAFRDLLREVGVARAEGGLNPTWPSLVRPVGLPIDHVLTSAELQARTSVGPHVGSDHRPMTTSIDWRR